MLLLVVRWNRSGRDEHPFDARHDDYSSYETDPADVKAAKMKEVRANAKEALGMTLDEAVQNVLDGKANPKELFN